MKGPRLLQQDCPHDGDYRHQGQRHFQGDPKARKKLSMQVNHKWYSRPILIRVRIAGLSLERVHVHVHVLSMYNQLTTPSIVPVNNDLFEETQARGSVNFIQEDRHRGYGHFSHGLFALVVGILDVIGLVRHFFEECKHISWLES